MEVPMKTKSRTTCDPVILLLCRIKTENMNSKRYIYPNVCNSIVCKSQDIEPTQIMYIIEWNRILYIVVYIFYYYIIINSNIYYNIHCIRAMPTEVLFVTSFSSHCWIVTAETIRPKTQSPRCLPSCLLHYTFSNPWFRAEIHFSERIWRKKRLGNQKWSHPRSTVQSFSQHVLWGVITTDIITIYWAFATYQAPCWQAFYML